MKSRVARARRALIAILDGDETLGSESRAASGDAAKEIMAELDRLVPDASLHRKSSDEGDDEEDE